MAPSETSGDWNHSEKFVLTQLKSIDSKLLDHSRQLVDSKVSLVQMEGRVTSRILKQVGQSEQRVLSAIDKKTEGFQSIKARVLLMSGGVSVVLGALVGLAIKLLTP